MMFSLILYAIISFLPFLKIKKERLTVTNTISGQLPPLSDKTCLLFPQQSSHCNKGIPLLFEAFYDPAQGFYCRRGRMHEHNCPRLNLFYYPPGNNLRGRPLPVHSIDSPKDGPVPQVPGNRNNLLVTFPVRRGK